MLVRNKEAQNFMKKFIAISVLVAGGLAGCTTTSNNANLRNTKHKYGLCHELKFFRTGPQCDAFANDEHEFSPDGQFTDGQFTYECKRKSQRKREPLKTGRPQEKHERN